MAKKRKYLSNQCFSDNINDAFFLRGCNSAFAGRAGDGNNDVKEG